MKHCPVHTTLIPQGWDSVEEIRILASTIAVTYKQNGVTHMRHYRVED